MSLKAKISNISRNSLHDGPGLRTVIYFSGCSLRCKWCHNPETITGKSDLLFAGIKCIRCGRCIEICPDTRKISEDGFELLRDNCIACGKCVDICPTSALSLSAKEKTLSEILNEIEKDIDYYKETSGGVTLSGGECLLHSDFCRELLLECKKRNIHTAIETALFVPWSNIKKVEPVCDLIFSDFKIANSDKHKKYTGKNNELILKNLKRLAELSPKKIILRIPLIPTVNDSQEDINDFSVALSPFADKLKGVEVLKYNSLAKSKYEIAGKEYYNFGEPQSDEEIKEYCDKLCKALQNKVNVYCI